MATSGRELPEEDRRRIKRLLESGASIRSAARLAQVSTTTVQKYGKAVVKRGRAYGSIRG